MQGFRIQTGLQGAVQALAEQIGHAEHHLVDLPGRDHHFPQIAFGYLLQQHATLLSKILEQLRTSHSNYHLHQ